MSILKQKFDGDYYPSEQIVPQSEEYIYNRTACNTALDVYAYFWYIERGRYWGSNLRLLCQRLSAQRRREKYEQDQNDQRC